MKLNEVFQSNFLKAEDLKGRDVTLTIEEVEADFITKDKSEGKKVIISFVGKDKKLVANKTNCRTIAKLYGEETDDWIGKQIIIGPREVEYQGEMTWAIRVSLKKPGTAAAAAPPPEPTPADDADSDPVPF